MTVPPVLLAILDGWGYAPPDVHNAVHVAETPNLDAISRQYPFTTLVAHNGLVGLPEGQMGNSEVGHLNIGAGRIVYQDFTRINLAVEKGDFHTNPVLLDAIQTVHARGKSLHLLGLLSDGGVHSHINHLLALVTMAARTGLTAVFIHAFMDGRDTPPKSGGAYMETLVRELERIGVGRVATVIGRYWAMDRDNRWERVALAWQAMVDGKGLTTTDGTAAVAAAYGRGETDEFIKPTVIHNGAGTPIGRIDDGDGIIFFNFRADRARQLTRAFNDEGFAGFPITHRPAVATYVTFTEYDKDHRLPIAFPPQKLTRILGEEISRQGLRQLRIAETEKYAHVTYFFNGGREAPFPLEDRVLIPSPQDVATYDLKPEMSVRAVTEELLRRLDEGGYHLIVLNFANGDMVGHSGKLAAAIAACEAVDECVGRIIAKVRELGGVAMITSDHGNAEIMYDPDSQCPHTAHSLNPVPFYLVSDRHCQARLRTDGSLRDIAPTILQVLNLDKPEEMEGTSLILP